MWETNHDDQVTVNIKVSGVANEKCFCSIWSFKHFCKIHSIFVISSLLTALSEFFSLRIQLVNEHWTLHIFICCCHFGCIYRVHACAHEQLINIEFPMQNNEILQMFVAYVEQVRCENTQWHITIMSDWWIFVPEYI